MALIIVRNCLLLPLLLVFFWTSEQSAVVLSIATINEAEESPEAARDKTTRQGRPLRAKKVKKATTTAHTQTNKKRIGNNLSRRRRVSTAIDHGTTKPKSKNKAKFIDSLNERINHLVEVVTSLAKRKPRRRCGCKGCNDYVWDARAPANAPEWFLTCGRRIEYLEKSKGLSHRQACRAIAGYEGGEFPVECGRCDPDRCDGRGGGRSNSKPNSNNYNDAKSPRPRRPVVAERTRSIYCFSPYERRKRWTDVWGDFTVEVKGDQSGSYCGPGNNKFSTNTVSLETDYNNTDRLKLKFQSFGPSWQGSEVRIESKMPYTYGTYRFSVGSVSVIDSPTGAIVSKVLPVDLVLGLFTWDTTENYATHENWNHEVDIEISRWGKSGNADGQFLIQPPGEPDEYRFFTGKRSSRPLDPGDNAYEFTWGPASITWSTTAGGGAGEKFTHTTEDALRRNLRDDIQCLPANVEVRINLWNRLGAQRPVDMTNNQHVEVTINEFSFIPSNIDSISDGQVCSKTCQCRATSRCIGNRCTAA